MMKRIAIYPRGYIFSQFYNDQTIDKTYHTLYHGFDFDVDLYVDDGIIEFDTVAPHPIQLQAIIENLYKHKLFDWQMYHHTFEKYIEPPKKLNEEDLSIARNPEMAMANFLASLGEIVLLSVESKSIGLSSLLTFFPKDLSLCNKKQLRRFKKYIDNTDHYDFIEGCLCEENYMNKECINEVQLREIVERFDLEKTK